MKNKQKSIRGLLHSGMTIKIKVGHGCQLLVNLKNCISILFNELNTFFFCSTSPLKASNRLNKISLTFL
jgi:hypothetical protein